MNHHIDSSFPAPSDLLTSALSTLDIPNTWCRGYTACDANGRPTSVDSLSATRFDSQAHLDMSSSSFLASRDRYRYVNHSPSSRTSNLAHAYLNASAAACGSTPRMINDFATSQFDPEMTAMWLGAVFSALADESHRTN